MKPAGRAGEALDCICDWALLDFLDEKALALLVREPELFDGHGLGCSAVIGVDAAEPCEAFSDDRRAPRPQRGFRPSVVAPHGPIFAGGHAGVKRGEKAEPRPRV
jgi:hypothetical protein